MTFVEKLKRSEAFTVVEILIVITVLGILATLVYTNVYLARDKAYEARSQTEFQTMVNALKLYVAKNNVYPADASRDVPPGIQEFVSPTGTGDNWPDAPWPDSVYDYEAWNIDTSNSDTETYQISIRFCAADGTNCKFPKEDWAAAFDEKSAYYYCLKGYCRAHSDRPYTHPGYCVNCPNHTAVKLPSE